MSQPPYWLGRYFFYAIGNTPTISFTRDLPPRTPGHILLLGCGDPRNVLFTVFNEESSSDRPLDITCSDMDPGIIARNILLFTMIMDRNILSQTLWRIFFDVKLNRDTHTALVDHCKKLCQYSSSRKAWADSPYASFLKFSTVKSMEEVHRAWEFYVEMETLPDDRQKFIRDAFSTRIKEAIKLNHFALSSRAAGPLIETAQSVYAEHAKHYAATGISSTRNAGSATLINPTFAYCFVGEGCNVHYLTSPLTPFHSAALFGNATRPLSVNDVLQAAQNQFREWCDAFHARVSPPSTTKVTLRFIVAEATALCRAFCALNSNHNTQTGVPASQWKTSVLSFDSSQYSPPGPAPTIFNVIDTSNLVDHVGYLNILVSVLPLRTPDGILYTESLLYRDNDPTKEFTQHLFADLGTMSLILGVAPLDFLSGFFSRSNTHELMLHHSFKGQFHQVTTWKSPTSSDIPTGASPPVVFDNVQLGTFLWDMYHRVFEEEDSSTFWSKHFENDRAIMSSDRIRHNRESFVLFLQLVRSNLALSDEDWESVMERFFSHQDGDTSMPMDTVNRQDLYAQLYRHKVHTPPSYRLNLPRQGRFSEWPSIPQLARVILVVPRSRIDKVFNDESVGTPMLQGDVRGSWSMNVFSAIHIAFGRVSATGTKASPRIAFEEDKVGGWRGRSPLVVSFTVPIQILIGLEPQSNISINLAIRSNPGPTTVIFVKKLGIKLVVFSAKLLDETQVHILPEPQSPPLQSPKVWTPPVQNIGPASPVSVTLDEECEIARWLTVRITVENSDIVRSFGSEGAIPEVKQLSPCILSVLVSGVSQDVNFPYPVRGGDFRLRLARKSLYIEVLVPPSSSFESEGMRLKPFPVAMPSADRPEVLAWNIHYLNLSRLPVMNCSRPKELSKWLDPHVGSMMSARERKLRKKQRKDGLMFVKDSLHALFVQASGIQGAKTRRLFSLVDGASNNSDTIIFVNDLRYDQAAHTVVCDAFLLPLTHDFIAGNERIFRKLVTQGNMVSIKLDEGEVASWKQLFPAFVERCRTKWIHGENCEYRSVGKIPLTEEIEHVPICSCGQGKDVDGMSKNAAWRPFAPHVTRIALSPLFAVSYLEPVFRDVNARRCWLCRGKGKPKLQECSKCQKVRYCGPECQRKDWPVHKKKCVKSK